MAHTALKAGGWLLLEVGLGMADAVSRLAGESGFAVDRVVADLQSIPRAVVARKPTF
jgi:hypothetical protein